MLLRDRFRDEKIPCALTHISTVSNSAVSAMHLKNLDRSKVFNWEAVLNPRFSRL